MNLSLDEIATHRARLREEIMERECLLAALDVAENYAARGHAAGTVALGSLISVLASTPSKSQPIEPPRTPAALPQPPPPRPYVHTDLEAYPAMSSGSAGPSRG